MSFIAHCNGRRVIKFALNISKANCLFVMSSHPGFKFVCTKSLPNWDAFAPNCANARALQAPAKSLEWEKKDGAVGAVHQPKSRVTHRKSCVQMRWIIYHSLSLPAANASSAKSQFVFANRKLFPSRRRQRGFVWKALGRINGFGQIRATLALVVFCVPVDFYLIALHADGCDSLLLSSASDASALAASVYLLSLWMCGAAGSENNHPHIYKKLKSNICRKIMLRGADYSRACHHVNFVCLSFVDILPNQNIYYTN